MNDRQMKIFTYAFDYPRETLAVTDEGDQILYGELKDLSERIGGVVGHRLAFVLCRNTPGSLLGYLGLLSSGGVPLLLDAGLAPQLLQELMAAYHPAFCLVPEDLPPQTMDVITKSGASSVEEVFDPDEVNMHAAEKAAGGSRSAGGESAGAPQREPVMKIRDYVLYRTAAEGKDPAVAPELRLLLTTSGSTGSSKLVRISGDNLDANAESIIEYLQITKTERPITVLPMQYSYGMSIIHTHVMAGAPIILTGYTLMEKGFWDRVRQEKVTSLCGVPYTFEMYRRLGLMQMDLPALRYITQAGGRLPEKRHMEYARWCAEQGIRFYVMYGQTEASPRMGWLPPRMAIEKCGSMGIAIPGGRIDLIDENGMVIPEAGSCEETGRAPAPAANPSGKNAADADSSEGKDAAAASREDAENILSPVGELVYTGPNVALGYALCAADLAKGDEFHGVLHTGDMARRDQDGYFYIVGRRSRFIKMAGKRIGLDQVERILRAAFPDLDLACAGKDDDLHVYIVLPGRQMEVPGTIPGVAAGAIQDAAAVELGGESKAAAGTVKLEESEEAAEWTDRILDRIQEMTGIPERRVKVFPVQEIPRSSSGKIRYAELT